MAPTSGAKTSLNASPNRLSVHASIEEEIFYPAARRSRRDAGDEVLEALEEHHLVKLTLAELEPMDPAHERYAAKVTVLIENVRHHVEEEEGQLFPAVRKSLDTKQLREIGGELVAAKHTAPTRPHPEAPDTPPGNIVAQYSPHRSTSPPTSTRRRPNGSATSSPDVVQSPRRQAFRHECCPARKLRFRSPPFVADERLAPSRAPHGERFLSGRWFTVFHLYFSTMTVMATRCATHPRCSARDLPAASPWHRTGVARPRDPTGSSGRLRLSPP